MTTRALIAAALVACACPNKPSTTGGGSGSNAAGGCDGIRAKVERLYRAEAEAQEKPDAKDPQRVDEAVADNTTMVMNDCVKHPDRVVACVSGATTVATIESQCLVPLDDDGREGEELRK